MKKYTTVAEFLADLDSTKKEQVELLRKIITKAHAGLEEHIKWNAPSYILDGVDRVTFNLLNKEGLVKLVLHMDTARREDRKADPVMQDDFGLINWQSDVRGIITLTDLADLKAKQDKIGDIIKRWLAIKV